MWMLVGCNYVVTIDIWEQDAEIMGLRETM
jgi:hypothetical protein